MKFEMSCELKREVVEAARNRVGGKFGMAGVGRVRCYLMVS